MKKEIILIGFFLLLTATLEGVILFSHHVKKGETITLDSGVRLDGMPRVDRLTWIFNGTVVAMMERVHRAFWRVLVQDKMKYALTKNRGLIIKNVDKNDEGEYVASSLDVNFITHSVHLLEPEYKVDVSGIKFRCEEDGLKIKCDFNFSVHPGRKMLAKICRISTKQDQSERSKNCDYDAVDSKLFVNDEVEAYQFSVEFNDTANRTIKATSKIFLQYSDLLDPHNLYNYNPQMLLLKTKAATRTQNPELKFGQQPANGETTEGPKNQDASTIGPVTQPQTSVSNTKEQVTTTTTTNATYPTATTPVSCCTKSQSTTSGPNKVLLTIPKGPLGTIKPTEDDYFEIISLSVFFWCMLTLAFCLGAIVATVVICSWYHCCKSKKRSREYEPPNNNVSDHELSELTVA
ncbi:uncharacterized protein LOC114541402 isoform X2 [Dendronephthya gigantea]|uniref:uncharacterized protein LOC114541402 isoform X2 n=1 Tax=Dendronephthya gigantea TaxID=151771 RepID=UPI00106C095A|nr:uncharacterized protein LOC114541402 isoform X2 [Dendronephthya gigantea]XP_028417150.1 uncharacterized protein LOC114541402 isoform X2 [Dendronephthya gigantea]